MYRIRILQEDKVLFEKSAQNELWAVYDGEYKEGDRIELSCDDGPAYVFVSLDDAMGENFAYLTGTYCIDIPFGEKRASYSPKAFTGSRHYLHVRTATSEELMEYRNLALNPYDCHENEGLFPHTHANVETRGESVFASRNAVDGLLANTFHGEWPYTSWGINRDPKAEFYLDFGRKVMVDAIAIYLRADFPHDAWWNKVSVTFSDSSALDFDLKKTGEKQLFEFDQREVSSLTLHSLIKADDDSPFPALTQIQVFGLEILGE